MTAPPPSFPTADPERTFALVVGVERYDAGPSWELPGPAHDAIRFRAWLRRAGVPDRNIVVLLSPAGDRDLGVPSRPASYDAVRRALVSELPSMHGELLWVWWGGHGVLDQREHVRLFCADATTADKRNLDLESARRSLASDALPGFDRQIWVVDACQTFEELHGFHHELPTETLPAGRRTQRHHQTLLLASTRGQRAANDPRRGTGLFSDSVLDVLESAPSSPWPPDPEAVYRETRARVEALRAQGRTGQVPAIRLHGPERGQVPTRPAAPRGAVRPTRELIQALMDYPMMVDPAERQAVVTQLGSRAVERMPRHHVARTDLVGIVGALGRRPGDLWSLYDAVTLLDDDECRARTLEEAVRTCAGAREHGA